MTTPDEFPLAELDKVVAACADVISTAVGLRRYGPQARHERRPYTTTREALLTDMDAVRLRFVELESALQDQEAQRHART